MNKRIIKQIILETIEQLVEDFVKIDPVYMEYVNNLFEKYGNIFTIPCDERKECSTIDYIITINEDTIDIECITHFKQFPPIKVDCSKNYKAIIDEILLHFEID